MMMSVIVTVTVHVIEQEDGAAAAAASTLIGVPAATSTLSPTTESEVHHHPLTPFLTWITFTCNLLVSDICSTCDFIAHLDCAADYRYKENINLLELKEEENEGPELDQSIDSAAYKVKNIEVGEDGTEIATEIEHFSHEHELKLSGDEVLNNEKCNGCLQAIFPPFYSCVNCSFFLHKSCANYPKQ